MGFFKKFSVKKPKAKTILKKSVKSLTPKKSPSRSSLPPPRKSKWAFDESFFISEKTKKFRFPKYKQDKRYLVQIKDLTDYKDLWDDLDTEERREYDIVDFERDFEGVLELEVTYFQTFIAKITAATFLPHKYFSSNRDQLLDYISLINNGEDYFEADDLTTKMLKAGLLMEKKGIFDTREKWEEYLISLTMKELKPYCLENEIKIPKRKADLVAVLLDNNIAIPEPIYFEATEKFTDYIDDFYDLYINQLKNNLTRFHPFYVPAALEAAIDDAENEYPDLAAKLEQEKDSKYWLSLTR